LIGEISRRSDSPCDNSEALHGVLDARQTIVNEAAIRIARLVGALHMGVAVTVAAAATVAATGLHRQLVLRPMRLR